MILPPSTQVSRPEEQFRRLWLPWEEAFARLTYKAEQEWVRRAQITWNVRRFSQNIADQYS